MAVLPGFLSSMMKYVGKLDYRWKKCRRWYKWLSVLPLTIAHLLAVASITVFGVGAGALASGTCCVAVAEEIPDTHTAWVDTSGRVVATTTESNNNLCYAIAWALMIYGCACMFCGVMLYIFTWLFVGLSFVYLYEQVNEDVPIEWFVLKPEVESVGIFQKMNRHKNNLGNIDRESYPGGFEGQMAYTGWILTNLPPHEKCWVPFNTAMGKLFFDRYPSQAAYIQFLASTNIESATATATAVDLPSVNLDTTAETDPLASGSTDEPVQRSAVVLASVVEDAFPDLDDKDEDDVSEEASVAKDEVHHPEQTGVSNTHVIPTAERV